MNITVCICQDSVHYVYLLGLFTEEVINKIVFHIYTIEYIINEVWLPVSCSKSSLPRVFRAGLCPDWDQWDQTKPVDNAREAMQQADDWLGIPQVKSVPVQ